MIGHRNEVHNFSNKIIKKWYAKTRAEFESYLYMRKLLTPHNTRLENGSQFSNLELKIYFKLFNFKINVIFYPLLLHYLKQYSHQISREHSINQTILKKKISPQESEK